MKKFKVVGNSTIVDAEMNCRNLEEATALFFSLKTSGSYHKVYIADNETGELYRTYDKQLIGGGIEETEWASLDLM